MKGETTSPLSLFLFIARRAALMCGKFSRDAGREDYPGNIKRYQGHKGARPILDIKPPALTFPPSSIPPRAIRLIEYVRRRRCRRRDTTLQPHLPNSICRPYTCDHRTYAALFRAAFIAREVNSRSEYFASFYPLLPLAFTGYSAAFIYVTTVYLPREEW